DPAPPATNRVRSLTTRNRSSSRSTRPQPGTSTPSTANVAPLGASRTAAASSSTTRPASATITGGPAVAIDASAHTTPPLAAARNLLIQFITASRSANPGAARRVYRKVRAAVTAASDFRGDRSDLLFGHTRPAAMPVRPAPRLPRPSHLSSSRSAGASAPRKPLLHPVVLPLHRPAIPAPARLRPALSCSEHRPRRPCEPQLLSAPPPAPAKPIGQTRCEQPHQFVLQAHEDLRAAGVPLAPGPPDELPVDALGGVHFRQHH